MKPLRQDAPLPLRRLGPLTGFVVAVTAALVALGVGGGALPAALASVLAALATSSAVAGLRRVRLRRRNRTEEEQARRARHEGAVRILWAASGDFLAAGWGRNDLERLRLLAMNLAEGQPLGPRLAERLRAAASAVMGSVVDRLGDVVLTAREAELDSAGVLRLEAAIRVLVRELDGVTFHPGMVVRFRPQAVARAAGQAVDACAALRESLRPGIASDVAAVVRALAEDRHRARVASGDLLIDLSGLPAGTRVEARPADLARALDELLERVFRGGPVGGPVRLACRATAADVALALSWPGRDRFQVDARAVTESLRLLCSYGARLAIAESESEVRVEAVLPAVAPVVTTAPAVGSA